MRNRKRQHDERDLPADALDRMTLAKPRSYEIARLENRQLTGPVPRSAKISESEPIAAMESHGRAAGAPHSTQLDEACPS
ncbi:hypothetical protein [Burkholderia sp. S-53]|uniref:hypothetical protein n=1 Tax=Burkholderia sp. S-53 TaxID=2906514 RepID=UPI0021D0F888|nr:hypothetical protein [Burkholderia sp. S-53]UXU85961.1 hypothetical protein LXM88_01365 [Burkholderia sp. S-53]